MKIKKYILTFAAVIGIIAIAAPTLAASSDFYQKALQSYNRNCQRARISTSNAIGCYSFDKLSEISNTISSLTTKVTSIENTLNPIPAQISNLQSTQVSQQNDINDLKEGSADNVPAIQSASMYIGNAGNFEKPAFVAPASGQIVAVSFTNASTMGTHASHYTTLSLERKTSQNGTVASVSTNTTPINAYVAHRIVDDLQSNAFNAGDVYSFKKTDIGGFAPQSNEMIVTIDYILD